MMHNTFESRTSRSFSNKSSPPRPLDLKSQKNAAILNCLTPPPTGWQDSTKMASFNDKFSHRPLRSSLFQVPPTPVTPQIAHPLMLAVMTEPLVTTKQTKSIETFVERETEEQMSDDSFKSSAKRARSTSVRANAIDDCHRPLKRQIREQDLIYNPLAALESYGVPARYVREKVSEIADKFLDRIEGASCLLKFVPQTKPGLNRVKITPRIQPDSPFYMHFSASLKRTSSESTGVTHLPPECARSMPLHTEVALLRAPLLASLLLSGHVYLGDTLELEVPCPEVFPEVMRWLYTGKCPVAARPRVEQCLEVLCGR